jgi:hypothetical protein
LTAPTVRALPIATYRLGIDYRPGDTIIFTIPADDSGRPIPVDPVDPDPVDPVDPVEPDPVDPVDPTPAEPTVKLVGLDEDLRINAGARVEFEVRTTDVATSARLRVFADGDADPDNGNEIAILSDAPAIATFPVTWMTEGVAPGLYSVYADLIDTETSLRAGPATGRVRINAQPLLVLSDPRDGLIVTRGRGFMVAWAGLDTDDNATIRIFIDDNDDPNDGYHTILADGISEDDINNRDLLVDTFDIELDEFYVGGEITDGLTTLAAYAGRVCLTHRLVGRFAPTELDLGEIAIIRPGSRNIALGQSIDVTGSYDDDAFADLILGDPRAIDIESHPGAVYVHRGLSEWPRELSADDLDIALIGEQHDSLAGQRVALLNKPARNDTRDLLIGAPGFLDGEYEQAGRAYKVNGVGLQPGMLHQLGSRILPTQQPGGGTPFPPGRAPANGSIIHGVFDEMAGMDVAGLGDLDGDGVADYALGGVGWQAPKGARSGRVVIVAGDNTFSDAYTDDFRGFGQNNLRGRFAVGENDDELVGYAIRGVRDFDRDEYDDVLIGAPDTFFGKAGRVGAAYLVFGGDNLFDPKQGDIYLPAVGFDYSGHQFIGENEGDFAGAAVISGDFDGDERPDVAIGAPGYDDACGRVYVIYNRPDLPEIILLSDVGTEFDGVIFEGMAEGDQLGYALAAGDADGDGADDLVMGAPGAVDQSGSAYLIYGGQPFDAVVTLFEMPSCDNLQGWQLSGEGAEARLGAALSSGGDLNGDWFTDVGIGAPGDENNPGGSAYLMFGRGAPK